MARHILFLFSIFGLPCFSQLNAQTSENLAESSLDSEVPELTIIDGIILGLVEGITEYLPVSSTGHLILTNALLGLDVETPMYDETGAPLWKEEPGEAFPDGIPYTFKDAADAYAIIIQAGAIAAVIFLYWRRVRDMLLGILGKHPQGFRLGINLLIAFMPAVVLGLLFDDWIESKLFGVGPVIIALIAGGFLMLAVEYWRKRKMQHAVVDEPGREIHTLSPLDALAIGFLQCVAMWPGTSRSMMTIVGGYLVGLRPTQAAEFSFLLGLITLSAAAAYKALKDGANMLIVLDPVSVLVGCIVAFVSAVLAIRWLVNALSRFGLTPFAYYRIILAIAIFAMIR
ncbi:MAG: undecaprenyl-diphosphate phosphatase [Verrucomicrobiota bacterium]